jgi:hypothetical protein
VARKSSGGGENEHHVVGVRMRITGSGNLDMVLRDLDNVRTYPMEPFVMASATRIEPTRLANFQSQRIQLHGSVDEIDEWFWIRRIIIFAKSVVVEYPG